MTGGRAVSAILAAFIIFLAAGCSSRALRGWSPENPGEARQLVKSLETQNLAVSDRRGVGRFRLENANGALSGRVAWLSVPPEKLRLELLSPFGQPVATIAGDGDEVMVRWSADGRILRGNADGSMTSKVFGMKIPWRVLASSLAFQVWLRPGADAYALLANEPDARVVTSPGGLFRRGQRLFFRPGENFPYKAEYDTGGSRVLTVEFYGKPDEAESRIVFLGENGENLTLWPERFITNQGVMENPFALKKP